MERAGIAIDIPAFHEFLQDVAQELKVLTKTIYSHAGMEFNIRSPQQLGNILFSVLKLKSPKSKDGKNSTNQQALEKLANEHPIVEAILQYRKLEKMRSTYLEPLPHLVDAHARLHTHFNQKGTATGRLSSSDPNLQNIPARGDLGRRMRACFVAGIGCALISSDYSQIELRVLAHMSKDKALLTAFRQGADIHTHTASLIYDRPMEEVTKEMRSNAKTINFGLIYGMGASKLAQELRLSLTAAKEFIENYFARLSGLKVFYDEVVAQAKRTGYVETLAGRRRTLRDITSSNTQLSSQAARQAVNTIIQGSAADIIKLAMLAVANNADLANLGAKILLQVHDELVLEVPLEHAEEAAMIVKACMENVCPKGIPLDVPLLAEWGVGKNWAEAH